MSELHRITLNAEVCGRRPCLRGTRVRVSDIFDMLAAGMSHDEILADYPCLKSATTPPPPARVRSAPT